MEAGAAAGSRGGGRAAGSGQASGPVAEQTDADVTQILNDLADTDDATAIARLIPQVYRELWALSASREARTSS